MTETQKILRSIVLYIDLQALPLDIYLTRNNPGPDPLLCYTLTTQVTEAVF